MTVKIAYESVWRAIHKSCGTKLLIFTVILIGYLLHVTLTHTCGRFEAMCLSIL